MSILFGELAGNDAYELLCVPPDASADEIRRAWRKQASAHHPDRVTDPTAKAAAEDRLRLINAARDVLTTRRAAYDAARRDPVPDEPGAPEAEELIDDPWAAATPGAGRSDAPEDPWESASPGRQPPPPPRPPPPPPPPAPPRYMAPQYPRARHSPGSRLAIGCAAVFAIFWVLIMGTALVFALQPDGPTPEASVPDDLAGTWAGTVKRVAGDRNSWDVELTLEEGLKLGEVRYLKGECTGTAVPVVNEGKTLTVETDFPDDMSGCDVGALNLTPRKGDKTDIVYYAANGEKEATAVLRHP
ncbi:J domain-containing protein [Actinomadura sp. WMMB 499]|uniref:J domain-containing protein n=1 Tax=Actinomadura sp. WMMB 499 TaxID=1219491 RepID=UPI001247197F|nr:J domain-containing protein [Actinomadura sp. WMMB 499]QFG20790.1 DnaJ domain-containing protein [Actinomadura sp. WMMB 499]